MALGDDLTVAVYNICMLYYCTGTVLAGVGVILSRADHWVYG
jgi:hypothetical protein